MIRSILSYAREYRYEFLAFVTGGTVMMLEVVGARLIAPYFGTSTYVWTAMIGVILAALAFGYWYGGRIADRVADHRSLALTLTLSAAVILVAAFIQEAVLDAISTKYLDLRLAALFAALILFGPASLAIGLVGPQLAKIRITSLEVTGRSIGRLEAMGALGSITGTFLSGYWLLAFFGARSLAISLVIVLILSSFAVERRFWLWRRAAVALVAILAIIIPNPLPQGVISDTDSAYARYRVTEQQVGLQKVHFLMTDNRSIQSGAYPDDPSQMIFAYTQKFMLSAHALAPADNILVIGGGTHTFPTALVRTFSDLQVDVVEIDPALDVLAAKYFGYQPSERLRIIHADGRQFLNTSHNQYDIAYMDAYSSLTPPFHLMTRETVEQLKNHLTDQGVVVVNIIGIPQAGGDDYLRAAVATYRSAFDHIELYQANPGLPAESRQNLTMIATNNTSRLEKLRTAMAKSPVRIDTGGLVMTDDYAPVERLSF